MYYIKYIVTILYRNCITVIQFRVNQKPRSLDYIAGIGTYKLCIIIPVMFELAIFEKII